MSKPVVAFGALGGTISMTEGSATDGISPTLGADDLTADLAAYAGVEIRPATLSRIGSSSLREVDIIEALVWAEQQIEQGSCAVVLSQGTDTLEETAWLLDLWWHRPEPLVVVAAMRGPQAPGADGAGNLAAGLVTAASPEARDRGVLVVLNDTIHAARWVEKRNTSRVDAFRSPSAGPVGMIAERRTHWFLPPVARPEPLPVPELTPGTKVPWVPVIWFHLGDDGRLARAATREGADAVVVAASGAGHVAPECADVLAEIAQAIPVVLCSRTGSGPVFEHTYGYPGAEIDLLRRGLYHGGWLAPLKARMLVWALLANQTEPRDLATVIGRYAATPANPGVPFAF